MLSVTSSVLSESAETVMLLKSAAGSATCCVYSTLPPIANRKARHPNMEQYRTMLLQWICETFALSPRDPLLNIASYRDVMLQGGQLVDEINAIQIYDLHLLVNSEMGHAGPGAAAAGTAARRCRP